MLILGVGGAVPPLRAFFSFNVKQYTNYGFQEIITDQWEKDWFNLTWSREISNLSNDFDSIGGSVIQ